MDSACTVYSHILDAFAGEGRWKPWWMGRAVRKDPKAFFFPLIGIRVLSLPPCSNKCLSLDRVFFPLPWHQLKYYHLLLLIAAAFHSDGGGSVYTEQLCMSQKPGNTWMGHVSSLHGRCVTSLSESLVWSLVHTLKKTPNLGWKNYWMLRLLWIEVELGTTPLTVTSAMKMAPFCHKIQLKKYLSTNITLSLNMFAVRQILVFLN